MYQSAIEQIQDEGGSIVVSGGVLGGEKYNSGWYVKPVIAEADNKFNIVQAETFAPILYLMKYSDINLYIVRHNYTKKNMLHLINELHETNQISRNILNNIKNVI